MTVKDKNFENILPGVTMGKKKTEHMNKKKKSLPPPPTSGLTKNFHHHESSIYIHEVSAVVPLIIRTCPEDERGGEIITMHPWFEIKNTRCMIKIAHLRWKGIVDENIGSIHFRTEGPDRSGRQQIPVVLGLEEFSQGLPVPLNAHLFNENHINSIMKKKVNKK